MNINPLLTDVLTHILNLDAYTQKVLHSSIYQIYLFILFVYFKFI
jgi:hypothetical protein